MASRNLSHRWYVGCALAGALPDHSSLTGIRQRLGSETFQLGFGQRDDFQVLCDAAVGLPFPPWSGEVTSPVRPVSA